MVVRWAPRAMGIDGRSMVTRAKCVRLLVTDCDGVLTDGGVYYSEAGEELKRFSVRDGVGVERLREAGIATAIISGEHSPCVQRRAEKLGITALYLGVRRKADLFERILAEHRLGPEELAAIGDDVNDLEFLDRAGASGLTAAPAGAMPEVMGMVHFWASRPGGQGAFREIAEWILSMRGGEPPSFGPADL